MTSKKYEYYDSGDLTHLPHEANFGYFVRVNEEQEMFWKLAGASVMEFTHSKKFIDEPEYARNFYELCHSIGGRENAFTHHITFELLKDFNIENKIEAFNIVFNAWERYNKINRSYLSEQIPNLQVLDDILDDIEGSDLSGKRYSNSFFNNICWYRPKRAIYFLGGGELISNGTDIIRWYYREFDQYDIMLERLGKIPLNFIVYVFKYAEDSHAKTRFFNKIYDKNSEYFYYPFHCYVKREYEDDQLMLYSEDLSDEEHLELFRQHIDVMIGGNIHSFPPDNVLREYLESYETLEQEPTLDRKLSYAFNNILEHQLGTIDVYKCVPNNLLLRYLSLNSLVIMLNTVTDYSEFQTKEYEEAFKNSSYEYFYFKIVKGCDWPYMVEKAKQTNDANLAYKIISDSKNEDQELMDILCTDPKELYKYLVTYVKERSELEIFLTERQRDAYQLYLRGRRNGVSSKNKKT